MIKINVSNQENAVCDYTTLAAALNSLRNNSEPVLIHLSQGTYRELCEINRANVTIEGDGIGKTVITGNRYALELMPDGHKRGTFRTQTLFINADNVTLKNLTIENSAGSGRKYGQALALYADGDRLIFDNVAFLGNQDTLFTAPLPPTAYEIGGFTGPKEFCERRNQKHLYTNCYIEGDVDFIFGGATAWFENCEIFSRMNPLTRPSSEPGPTYGYITAASTPEGLPYGYIFNNCRFTSDCPKESVYLGRPWRNFAKTVLINCELGGHIKKEGWNNWGKTDAESTIFYAEYGSKGPGGDTSERASFAHLLTDAEAGEYTRINILGF